MDLISFISSKINEDISTSFTEDELVDFLSKDTIIYDYSDIFRELCEDYHIEPIVRDFVDFEEFASNDGFIIVNDDCFLHNSRFNEWLERFNSYDNFIDFYHKEFVGI